jgi:hypothetical protein
MLDCLPASLPALPCPQTLISAHTPTSQIACCRGEWLTETPARPSLALHRSISSLNISLPPPHARTPSQTHTGRSKRAHYRGMDDLVRVLGSFLDGTAEPFQWGILAGCCVYVATVLVVLYLLMAGGSFRRMREQVGMADACHAAYRSRVPLPTASLEALIRTNTYTRPRLTSSTGPRPSRSP